MTPAFGFQYLRFLAGLVVFGLMTLPSNAQQSLGLGYLKLEVWTNITTGGMVADLTSDPRYPSSPDEVHFVNRFEIPPAKYVPGNDPGIPAGQKLSGFIIPAQTTNYVFYLSANTSGELWLSTDERPVNLKLIASASLNFPARTYEPEGASEPIQLIAGQSYYVEALEAQDGGRLQADLMSVAWTMVGDPTPVFGSEPIPGRFLGSSTTADSSPPAAISNLTVESATRGLTFLWLNWTAPADSGGEATTAAHYEVRYSTRAIPNEAAWATATLVDTAFLFPSIPGDPEVLKINNLAQNTLYYFAVRAVDRAGNLGPMSNAAKGQTKFVTGDINVVWDLEFNEDGINPASRGDWVSRNGGSPGARVAKGILKASSFDPILDTKPKDNFTNKFIVEFRARCTTPVADGSTFKGATFFMNLDYDRSPGAGSNTFAAVGLALQKRSNDTQDLVVIHKPNGIETIATNYPGLTLDFHAIRGEFDPPNNNLTIYIDGDLMGSITYGKQRINNDDRYATILAWEASAEFDYVRVGYPVAPPLEVNVSGNEVAVSWDAGAVGWTLEGSPTLSSALWVPVPETPVVRSGRYLIIHLLGAGNRYYRLRK